QGMSKSRKAKMVKIFEKLLKGASDVGDAPHRAVAVFCDEQRAVVGDRHADWTTPDAPVVYDEARQEIVILAGGHAVIHAHADDFVACAGSAVPRAVERGKGVALIVARKSSRAGGGGVEGHLQGGGMGLFEDVGHDGFAGE